MRLDGHIHTAIRPEDYVTQGAANTDDLEKKLQAAGLSGGVLFSVDPFRFSDWTPEKRIQDVLDTCGGKENFFPFYYINPMEDGALDQVKLAVDMGIDGFKMICSRYQVSDQKCLDVCEKIASYNKPVLFHSGICWDGVASANNNKPANFEALIDIPRLRFCLAHISWPWYDECIAVYGKFNNAYYSRPDLSCEMFIDCTPGTPRPYRREAMTHLLQWSEYELRYNLIFGTDCFTPNYNTAWALEWQKRDDEIYADLIRDDVEDFKDHVYCKNLLRFLGKSDEKPVKYIPMVGQ